MVEQATAASATLGAQVVDLARFVAGFRIGPRGAEPALEPWPANLEPARRRPGGGDACRPSGSVAIARSNRRMEAL